MTDPKFVAFSTQKGGAGKTTLTVLAASYLYCQKGLKILVVDCDYPQYSIEEMRQRDKDLIECSPRFKKLFSANLRQTKLTPYPLLTAKPEEAMQKVRDIIEAGNEIDIVFFDLPGTVNNNHVINTIAQMDYVFCPITTDPMVMETSIAFSNIVQNEFISTGKSNIKGLHLLWNKVPSRERNDLQRLCEQFVSVLGIPVMETVLPDSTKFRKEGQGEKRFSVFRSTILPPDKASLKGSGIEEMADEIMGIIGI